MIAVPQSLEPEHIAALFKEIERLREVETAARRFRIAYARFERIDVEGNPRRAVTGARAWNDTEERREELFALMPLADQR